MTRVAVALACSAEQRAELVSLARSRTAEARLVERARIVLACLEGKRNDEVSRELGVRPNTVGLWRKRFAAGGIAGLRDQARPGKKPKYGAELRQRLLRQRELPPPPGLAAWDGGSLAAALGVSDDAVWRVLRHDGIQLRRHRSWCVSTDPQFAAKAADIIGLYRNPPEHALVLSVDEKPSLQALERTTGYVQTSSGRMALAGASFGRAEQLRQAIQDFTTAYNEHASPFVWRKREVNGSQLRHTIVNLRN